MEEITMEDYLNNSGTRVETEPLYKTHSLSIKSYRFRLDKDGRYTKIDTTVPKYKLIRIY